MERIWAPWRVQYISAEKEDGCIFCDKPKQEKDKENYILHRGDQALLMLNAYPYNNGHLMVAPYRHVADISDLTDDELLSIMHLVSLGKQALAKAFSPDGYNIGINMGKTAGAGIADHIHVHIVPRWNGDTNFMPVIADTKVMPQALSNTFDQISEAISKLIGS
ncbi:MAG: HIT domain-containing protein [Armatimonadota bacterium]